MPLPPHADTNPPPVSGAHKDPGQHSGLESSTGPEGESCPSSWRASGPRLDLAFAWLYQEYCAPTSQLASRAPWTSTRTASSACSPACRRSRTGRVRGRPCSPLSQGVPRPCLPFFLGSEQQLFLSTKPVLHARILAPPPLPALPHAQNRSLQCRFVP